MAVESFGDVYIVIGIIHTEITSRYTFGIWYKSTIHTVHIKIRGD